MTSTTIPRQTTVGSLGSPDIGQQVEIHMPGRPRGEFRGASDSGDDEGGMTVILGTPEGRRTVTCRSATPAVVFVEVL